MEHDPPDHSLAVVNVVVVFRPLAATAFRGLDEREGGLGHVKHQSQFDCRRLETKMIRNLTLRSCVSWPFSCVIRPSREVYKANKAGPRIGAARHPCCASRVCAALAR